MPKDQMMRVPRPTSSRFSQVPRAEISRSQFDLSHGIKTTFDAGWLVPILVDEALPGDTWNVNLTAFARLATPLKPLMDNLYLETFFFAVPYRLVWDNWQKFNGEQTNPGDSTDFVIPQLANLGGNETVISNELGDYMGLPLGLDPALTPVSSLPFRAYILIWDEWFRDQNLQDSTGIITDDGPDNAALLLALRKRGKRHDYFTSALPWPQKGDSVLLPLGTRADVTADADRAAGATLGVMSSVDELPGRLQVSTAPGNVELSDLASTTTLYADLTNATAASINELRQAFQIQRLLERDARGGTRYTEIIRAHFGVSSPDQRLQRPEYLGGGSTYVNISPVAQTSSTDATTPQANLSGIGTAMIQGHSFSKSFTEHSIIIGLVNVRADLSYQQGLHRMWSRRTRFDFYWPALAHIGEQAVLNKEIFWQGTAADDQVFGYQERYAEYRYKPSQITGLFRSTAAQPLDIWHLAQDFAALPVLDELFIEDDPPIDRVIAVPSEPHFLFDGFFRIKAARPMPVYGVPGLIDHF